METIVFIILQIFYATYAVLKIGVYLLGYPPVFGHVSCLDQSRASEKIWWIIIYDICDKILPDALANSSNQARPGVTI